MSKIKKFFTRDTINSFMIVLGVNMILLSRQNFDLLLFIVINFTLLSQTLTCYFMRETIKSQHENIEHITNCYHDLLGRDRNKFLNVEAKIVEEVHSDSNRNKISFTDN